MSLTVILRALHVADQTITSGPQKQAQQRRSCFIIIPTAHTLLRHKKNSLPLKTLINKIINITTAIRQVAWI
jgi:hypothetical protein